jgi:hypothetical protein
MTGMTTHIRQKNDLGAFKAFVAAASLPAS